MLLPSFFILVHLTQLKPNDLSAISSHLIFIYTTLYSALAQVALRIIAKPSSKDYGIPSVVFQLYGAPTMNFLIPPSVFYPKPKVDSALLTLGS